MAIRCLIQLYRRSESVGSCFGGVGAVISRRLKDRRSVCSPVCVSANRHKLHPKYFAKGGFGQTEVKLIWDMLKPLCEPNNKFRPTPIFRDKPHITWDNYFCGDQLMEYAAEEGFGLTMTVRRDRLPADIPNKHLQKQKTDSSARPRAARFQHPIFCVKKAGNGGTMQLTSFQSTSSCNIMHVNAINSNQLYCSQKERGRGEYRRKWAIEMNESRRLYLKSYGAIDRLDHLIQNTNMSYRCWKYWHAPMLHAKSMAVVIAYDIYKECSMGLMRAGEWKVEKPVDFHRFREKLAVQMLQYSPQNRKYVGDEKFRVSTAQHKARRTCTTTTQDGLSNSRSSSSATSVTSESIKEASGRRLCGDLCPLIEHVSSVKKIPNRNKKVCVVCGKDCYHVCMLCVGEDGKNGVAMHSVGQKTGGIPCILQYHNTGYFGLAKADYRMNGNGKKRDWSQPTEDDQQQHYKKIRRVLASDSSLVNRLPLLPRRGLQVDDEEFGDRRAV